VEISGTELELELELDDLLVFADAVVTSESAWV